MRTTPQFAVASLRPLFTIADIDGSNPHTPYDVSPDGRTFAMVRRSQQHGSWPVGASVVDASAGAGTKGDAVVALLLGLAVLAIRRRSPMTALEKPAETA